MAQQMMWDPIATNYRGQASDGTVVTVDQKAMELANKNAGKTVYDSDWWVETVHSTLEHWGIYPKRSVDRASMVQRLDFSVNAPPGAGEGGTGQSEPDEQANQLTKPLTSGPLTNRLMSGPLNTKNLDKDRGR